MILLTYVIVISLTLLPLLVIMYLFKETAPKYYGYLFWGTLLIIWAAIVFGALVEIKGNFLAKYPDAGKLPLAQQTDYKKVIANMELWIFLFPSVIAGIGVNLVTDFIKLKKPENITGSSIT